MIKRAAESIKQLIVEVETDPDVCAEVAARRERCERNWRWLEANAAEAYSHQGKYICIAERELFVADCPQDALRAAVSAHPDDDGRFVLYIPREKLPRIYAG